MNILKNFKGRFVILGYGGMASSLTPILIDIRKVSNNNILVITKKTLFKEIAEEYNLEVIFEEITKENYKEVLTKYVKEGDFVINLTVNVDNIEVAEYILLDFKVAGGLDTSHEQWAGGLDDENKTIAERSGAIERERGLKLKEKAGNCPTYIFCSGMNPGVVSYFAKYGLLAIAKHFLNNFKTPKTQIEWALLAYTLGVKTIHIAEHDAQIANYIKTPNTFVNTWSCDGFRTEGMQASSGWLGTHEKIEDHIFVIDGKRSYVMNKAGIRTKIKTFTPISKITEGYMVEHNESHSIGEYLTIPNLYSPTVHYAYTPCDLAQISINELNSTQDYTMHEKQHLLRDEIITGKDELGVLIMGVFNGKPYSHWTGSLLSIEDARKVAKYNTATSLQVMAGIISGIEFALENPNMGILECDEIDASVVFDKIEPFMGEMFCDFVPFNPLDHKDPFFEKDYNDRNPFDMNNFLVY